MNNLQAQFVTAFVTEDRWKAYLEGLVAFGIVLGILVAVIRTIHDQNIGRNNWLINFLNGICQVYTTIIRGTPMLVQLMVFYFVIFSSSRAKVAISILALGINSGAYVAEIIRSGIMSIDPGQMEAGRSLGLGYTQVMRSVIIPQAIKNILPALGNEMITLFKDTSLVTVIGVTDLTKVAQTIGAKTYSYFMPMIGIALIYLLNVIDAYVDASMMHFDVSDDLSMQLKPAVIESNISPLPSVGLGCAFSF